MIKFTAKASGSTSAEEWHLFNSTRLMTQVALFSLHGKNKHKKQKITKAQQAQIYHSLKKKKKIFKLQ